MSWGVKPAAMIGHSVGEYVAGCLAGVFTLEDALSLVARRAALVQAQPGGAMLADPAAGSRSCAAAESANWRSRPSTRRICAWFPARTRRSPRWKNSLRPRESRPGGCNTSHAFHSPMMEPVLAPFHRIACAR